MGKYIKKVNKIKDIFTPEENMIITLDYYIAKLKKEKETEENNLKYAENRLKDSITLTESLRAAKEMEYRKGKINAYEKAIIILEERD